MQVLDTGQFVIHLLNRKGVEGGGVEKKQPARLEHLASALKGGAGSEDEGEGRGRGRETEAEYQQRSGWRGIA